MKRTYSVLIQRDFHPAPKSVNLSQSTVGPSRNSFGIVSVSWQVMRLFLLLRTVLACAEGVYGTDIANHVPAQVPKRELLWAQESKESYHMCRAYIRSMSTSKSDFTCFVPGSSFPVVPSYPNISLLLTGLLAWTCVNHSPTNLVFGQWGDLLITSWNDNPLWH